MLYQIVLYRQIPDVMLNVRGVIDETRQRLLGVSLEDSGLAGKYRNRLARAERALKVLSELYLSLNE